MEPLSKLLAVLMQGESLIREEGIDASLHGPYPDPFGRDTFETIAGLLFAIEDFKDQIHKEEIASSFTNEKLLIGAARSYLQHIAREDDLERNIYAGALPHEIAIRRTALPSFLDMIDSTGKRAFVSIDANGHAMCVLQQIFRMKPANEALENEFLPFLKLMTNWVLRNLKEYGGMIGYTGYKQDVDPEKKEGGIDYIFQDGKYSILTEEGKIPSHPMHTVFEQALYWKALHFVADLLKTNDAELSKKAKTAASLLKENFNKYFVYTHNGQIRIARAIDGKGNKIKTINIDELNALGLTYKGKTILNEEHEHELPDIVEDLFSSLYTPYGLRTQALGSPVREGYEYHGPRSLWPFGSSKAARALSMELAPIVAKYNPDIAKLFHQHGIAIAKATASLLLSFNSPIETAQLSIHNGKTKLSLYREAVANGVTFESARVQAWTVGWGKWVYEFLKANGIINIPVLAIVV